MTQTAERYLAEDTSSVETRNNVHQLRRRPARMLINEHTGSMRDYVMSALDELVHLEKGWDGYHGQPVRLANAIFALQMLDVVSDDHTPMPQIVPGVGGDLQIEWHEVNADIELHVRAPNRVVAWRRTEDTEPEGEEIDLTNDFIDVADWINALTDQVNAVEAAPA